MAAPVSRQFLHLIRQFCAEEKLEGTMHVLEKETGFYLDVKYLEELVMIGQWDEAEKYLSAFTAVDANDISLRIYFELRKQKLLETLDRDDRHKGLDILLNDLKIIAATNEELYKEMTTLLTMDDFRKHHSLATYGDIVLGGRKRAMDEIRPLISAHPHLCDKMEAGPEMSESKLRRIVDQSLNWQNSASANVDSRPQAQTHLRSRSSTVERSLDLPHQIIEPAGNSVTSTALRIRNHDNTTNTQSTPMEVIQTQDPHDHIQAGGTSSGMQALEKMMTLVSNPNIPGPSLMNLNSDNAAEDFPKTVRRCLAVESPPTSIDFHPLKETLLLVGTISGGIEIWDLTAQVKLFWTSFMLWKRETMSRSLMSELEKDRHISVKRVLWCPDGTLFGVAYSKHIVQLFAYNGVANYIEKHFEINAHEGAVNDIAFSTINDELFLITGGEDKIVQVWSTQTGAKLYTFQGHTAPIYSVCSHAKQGIDFVFSTSVNGEIKAWLYDESAPKVVEYEAPGHSCVKMIYSSDGKRLFSGGTNKDGESFLVEWNENDGFITRTYCGLCKPCPGIVQYETSKNKYLVAGDDHLVKVWDMDNIGIWTIVGAADSLPANPYLRFSKSGNMLGVFSEDHKIKVLANETGAQILQTAASSSCIDVNGIHSKSLQKDLCNMRFSLPSSFMGLHQLLIGRNNSRVYPVSSCKCFILPSDHTPINQICGLAYTHSGNGVLALAADGIHFLWKWSANQHNNLGKMPLQATAIHSSPQLWQPRSGLAMINEVGDHDPFRLITHCLAISKNDSYLVSASGKAVSLFNMMTFQRMRSFLRPPPIATCLTFYPSDNNIVAIGFDDSRVLIYNVRLDQLAYRLSGHTKRITGLAFSNTLKVLISSAVDTQIFMWDCVAWKLRKSTALQINAAWLPSDTSVTTLQFHRDQKHFLVVHETQLAVYEAVNLERVVQWTIGDFCARILHATFSCDNQLVYTVVKDGNVIIFGASDLVPKLMIDPSVYLPANVSGGVYPMAIAAHPQKPNQFAMGLSNGTVIVVEPEEFAGRWITMPPPDGNNIATGKSQIIKD